MPLRRARVAAYPHKLQQVLVTLGSPARVQAQQPRRRRAAATAVVQAAASAASASPPAPPRASPWAAFAALSTPLTNLFPVWVLGAAFWALRHPSTFPSIEARYVTPALAWTMLGMGLTLTFEVRGTGQGEAGVCGGGGWVGGWPGGADL